MQVTSSPFVDGFGRRVTYLRLSVTDRCDLRCTYCMPQHMIFSPRSSLLGVAELDRIGPGDVVVLELSSFQLWWTRRIQRSPHVTLVTNLFPEHIDRHGTQGAIDDFVGLMPWGTPEMILEKFDEMRKLVGMNGIMPGFSYGGMPFADAEASLRLFSAECLPELKRWETEPLAVPGIGALAGR